MAPSDELFLRCERFLFGHGLQSPRSVLAELAEEAGDEEPDRYGEGPLINDFEREVATLLGKDAAVFLPSGTMAQQIALRIWADDRQSNMVAFHPTCHLEIHEEKAYERLHGLNAIVAVEPNNLIRRANLEAVTERVGAVLIELPQREIGGVLLPWAELADLSAWCREKSVAPCARTGCDGVMIRSRRHSTGRRCS